MVKLRLNKLSLKVILSLFMSLSILALLASCIGQPMPMPAEESPTPTETPPAPPESEELPGAELFMAPELPPPGEIPAYTPGPAVDCFLEIDGIPGESTDDRHDEWIEILSYSWGVSQPASGSLSSGGLRSAERADHTAFSVVKTLDKTSPKLALYVCSGEHIEEVTLELCHSEGDKQKFMEYKMEDVIVSSVRPSGPTQGGEALPLEEVSFNYGKITWTYTELDPVTLKAKGDVEAYWDLESNSGG
jgi:type VI secretion system secreted protein Hcp